MDSFALLTFWRIAEGSYLASTDSHRLSMAFKLDGFLECLWVTGQISAEQHIALNRLVDSLIFRCSSSGFPSPKNAGPVMPSYVALARRVPA